MDQNKRSSVGSWALASFLFVLVSGTLGAAERPEGTWGLERSQKLLDKTLVVRLDPDLSGLASSEMAAVRKLLEAGQIFQKLYETSRHHQAQSAHKDLLVLDRRFGSPPDTQNLLALYRIFKGPIATTLENERVPFLPVDSIVPGVNVYPWGVRKEEMEAFLAEGSDKRSALLHVRSIVRRTGPEVVRADLEALRRHPVLDVLHPGLRSRLEGFRGQGNAPRFYALPYSVAYSEDLLRAHELLHEAASHVESSDIEFARYLRHRARDLLVDDYEAGDAAWVTSDFGKLNAAIGSYEVYDDKLYGVKSFFGLSLLLRDEKRSQELRQAVRGIQGYENSLPYENHKKVREDIPVGVYQIIADFGQARGTNTATILPNEGHIARKYGRTILLRHNIMAHPELIQIRRQEWQSVMEDAFHDDFKAEGNFYRTLWHEIGHYLGVEQDRQGRDLDVALEENSSALEEMKADLVSLFLARGLAKKGYYDDEVLRGLYASGVSRVLLKNRPRREQAYHTMRLMQMNYFLENGLLEFDGKRKTLRIHYQKYHETVANLLRQVLAVQYEGDRTAADRFIERYTSWNPDLHGVLANKMRDTEKWRYRLVRYAVLGE